jgi:hypothetical protein
MVDFTGEVVGSVFDSCFDELKYIYILYVSDWLSVLRLLGAGWSNPRTLSIISMLKY